MATRSNLNQIQTTVPPLIAQSNPEACISRGLTFFGPLSISVPGTGQLDQGYYSMSTKYPPVKDDKVRSLCLRQDVSWVTVQLTCTLVHKGRLQASRDVIKNGIVPPGQSSLVQCMFTMDKNTEQHLLRHVPTELLRLVKVGNMSMLLFTANFRTPRGRFHMYNYHMMLSLSACNRARSPCNDVCNDVLSSPSSKTLPTSRLMADTFGTVSACVGMGSTCGGCGPGSTIGYRCNGKSRSPGSVCKGL
jgi:hypothetical protein